MAHECTQKLYKDETQCIAIVMAIFQAHQKQVVQRNDKQT